MAKQQAISIYQPRVKKNGRAKKKKNRHHSSKPYNRQGR